jgi:hypothetical protein
MTTWKHTKKILFNCLSTEGSTQHENYSQNETSNVYADWYFNQVEAGLADPNLVFDDICKKISDTEWSILVIDQAQADSYIAMAYAIGDEIGYPLNHIVVDHTE